MSEISSTSCNKRLNGIDNKIGRNKYTNKILGLFFLILLRIIVKSKEELNPYIIIKNSKFDISIYFTLLSFFSVALRLICLYSLTVRDGEVEIIWLQNT